MTPGRRGPGGGHRPQRLPQPDQQRAGLPGHLPGGAGRAGQRHQRGDEDGRRHGPGLRHPGGGAVRGEHHPQALRSPSVPAVAAAVAEAARKTGVARKLS